MTADDRRRWWTDAVGYEIYLRSFSDGDGDGVGDFVGATQRLDHVAALGIDLVWVTPFYPSPMADFGYDISSYVEVDPLFGTVDDVQRFLDRAHELGLKVVFDLVPNHTSDQHPWFLASASSIDDPKRDWYLWQDPAPDGGPPNNWVSHFGGSSWTFHEPTGQYYCHSFLSEQPDLNWRHPEVVAAFDDILDTWLDRGVDGFRIDVTQGLVKDATFRSNPELRPLEPGMSRFEQWDSFEHRYDILQPETLDVFRSWRQKCDARDALLIGETYVLDAAALRHFLEPHDGIHVGFWFDPMHVDWDPEALRAVLADPHREAGANVGWVMSSHDDPRAPGRFGGGQIGAERALGLFTMLSMMPGVPFLYMGDELGLSDGEVPPERFIDPVVFRTGVKSDNRDGCRTPIPWEPGSPMFGFTTADDGWLPHGGRTDADTVAAQAARPGSPLRKMQELLSVRPAWLEAGLAEHQSIEVAAPSHDQPSLVRVDRGRFVGVLNTGDEPVDVVVGPDTEVVYRSLAGEPAATDQPTITLRGREAVVARRASA